MADEFEQLKAKYQSVLNFMQQQNVQLQNVNMEGDKLFIRATAPSQDVKNRVWDQIKLVDSAILRFERRHSSSARRPQLRQVGSASGPRTYTVQAGDNLSKISKHFYGDPTST